MNFSTNESTIDRIVRVVVGIALAALAIAGSLAAPLLYVVWAVAAIALITGVVGFCPLYAVVGFRTKAR
jgi:hypothetical protein